ncbi:MAG: GNAT family N-acetyltransferase [Beijerinckiaceae bacterium]
MTASVGRGGRCHNSLRFEIVTTPEQWLHACAIRSICFLDEHGCQAKWLFDGNDYQCTHVVAYDGDEPIGTGRVRWFKDFAKIERTLFRKEHRDIRALKQYAEFGFDHIRRKGYTRVITHAGPKYARLWKQILGFKDADGKAPALFEGHEPYYEIYKDLEPAPDAITTEAGANVLFRIEGHWDEPAPYEIAPK